MNDAHFHLVVNHLPIILPLVGIIVLVTGLISKSEPIKRTAFMIFVLGAIATIFAIQSGDGAEEIVEKINGISKDFIKSHEEAADLFATMSYILGGISILGIWSSFKQKAFSNSIVIATLIFAFVVLFFGQKVGTTGGEIRHTEIRSDYNVQANDKINAEKHDND